MISDQHKISDLRIMIYDQQLLQPLVKQKQTFRSNAFPLSAIRLQMDTMNIGRGLDAADWRLMNEDWWPMMTTDTTTDDCQHCHVTTATTLTTDSAIGPQNRRSAHRTALLWT